MMLKLGDLIAVSIIDGRFTNWLVNLMYQENSISYTLKYIRTYYFIMAKLGTKLTTKFQRLRFLRSLLGATRGEIEKQYNIPEVTLKKWETGNIPLTNKGIFRCLEVYKQEGINTTFEWIEKGIGEMPSIGKIHNTISSNSSTILDHFTTFYPDCVIHKVSNNLMFPAYKKGDTIVAVKYKGNYENLHNKDCLVRFKNHSSTIAIIHVLENKIGLLSYGVVADKRLSMVPMDNIEELLPIIWRKLNVDGK